MQRAKKHPIDVQMKFLIADDHPICSSMISLAILSCWKDAKIEVATSLAAVMRALEAEAVELLILDLDLEDSTGLRTLAIIRGHFPDTVVLVFTGNPRLEYARAAWALGAEGMLSKELPREELSDAIGSVVSGRNLPIYHAGKSAGDRLGAGPLRVLPLLLDGRSNQDIADELGLTRDTIKKHLANVFQALGVASRTQVISLMQGIIVNQPSRGP